MPDDRTSRHSDDASVTLLTMEEIRFPYGLPRQEGSGTNGVE